MKVIKVKLSAWGIQRIIDRKNSENKDMNFIQCLWKYAVFSKNMNRTFISCPFCNDNHSFKKIYDVTNYTKCNLIYAYQDAIIKVGNSMMFIVSENGKLVYMIPDLYFHFFVEHNMIPKEKFRNAVLYGVKPGTEEYFNYIQGIFLNTQEKKLMSKNKLIISGRRCRFCKTELQGKIAYRILDDYKNQICSYNQQINSKILDGSKYRYICYKCGHYN